MTWRKPTQDEIGELGEFVDLMKRGQTPPTGDSLLETLRQIHDRREVPIPEHSHREMLRQRLRRQVAARDGQPASDEPVAAPVFTLPQAPRSRVVEWAVAASLLLHAGFGLLATQYIQFDQSLVASILNQPDEDITVLDFSTARPLVLPRIEAPKPASQDRRASASTEPGRKAVGLPVASEHPSPATVFTPPPPTAPAMQPIIAPPSAPAEALAERNLPGGAEMPALRPPEPDEKRPMSDVAGLQFERNVDVQPKVLNHPKPRYSAEALQYQITGVVRLSVVFAADGSVQDIRVVRGLGWGLDDAAIEAVRRYKFTPAMKNGVPVSIRSNVDVKFELR